MGAPVLQQLSERRENAPHADVCLQVWSEPGTCTSLLQWGWCYCVLTQNKKETQTAHYLASSKHLKHCGSQQEDAVGPCPPLHGATSAAIPDLDERSTKPMWPRAPRREPQGEPASPTRRGKHEHAFPSGEPGSTSPVSTSSFLLSHPRPRAPPWTWSGGGSGSTGF